MATVLKYRYHAVIITAYAFVCIYFFASTPSPSSYFQFNTGDVVWLAFVFVCAFTSLLVVNYFLHFGTIEAVRKTPAQALATLFYACLLIALPEEIIFRAFVQGGLESIIPNTSVVIVFSAIIFGIAHILNEASSFSPKGWNWKLVTMAFIAGLYLGLLYSVTKSLLMPIVLHTLFVVALKYCFHRKSFLRIN